MKLRRNRPTAEIEDPAVDPERDETPPLDDLWDDDGFVDDDQEPPKALDLASPKRLWSWAIVIALLGVTVRALWYYNFQDAMPLRLGPDGDTFLGQARVFLAGGVTDPSAPGMINADREILAPGYGLFLAALWSILPRSEVLALTSQTELIAFVTQSLLVALSTLMTFAISRRFLFGFTALIPPALLTASIAVTEMSNMFAYETPLLFLLTAMVWLLLIAQEHADDEHSSRYLLLTMLAGLAFSAAILMQPRVIVALPFLIWWAVKAVNWEHALVLILVALILPVGWTARNYAQFERLVPISIGPQESLYIDNVDPSVGDGVAQGAAPPGCPRTELTSRRIDDRFDWGDCMQQAGVELITANPATAAAAIPGRLGALFTLWNPDYASGQYTSARWGYQNLIPQSVRNDPAYDTSFDIAAILLMIAYAALTIAGLWILFAEGPGSGGRLLAIFVISLPLVHLVFHGEGRFRVPVLPFILIALTLGALQVLDLLRRSRDRKRDGALSTQ